VAPVDDWCAVNRLSQRYGVWLDKGYRVSRLAGEMLFMGVAVLLPAGFFTAHTATLHSLDSRSALPRMWIFTFSLLLLSTATVGAGVWEELKDWDMRRGIHPRFQRLSWFLVMTGIALACSALYSTLAGWDLTTYLGALVAGTTVGLVTLGDRVKKLALGLRPVLDAALDVECHLRPFPRAHTPRACMSARYASLLRYLCNAAGDDGVPRGYDAIVIIAHSQGTVITADLLRFLECQKTTLAPDPSLKRLCAEPGARARCHRNAPIPIYFFTMGCPLRQLYGLRFPHLYDWARHYFHERRLQDLIPDDQRPLPKQLASVVVWANAYRSGDYIGRHLWRSDVSSHWCVMPWEESQPDVSELPRVVSTDANATRREFCIGAGAHTNYWDQSAPTIAAYLDLLIMEAIHGGS
jgi:hypothetical protein